jgi:hypothetical protein
MNKTQWLRTALFCAMVPAAAQAQTLYTSETDFLAAAGVAFSPMQSFESLSAGASTNQIVLPDFTMSTTTNVLQVTTSAILGAHATDGTSYVRWSAPSPGSVVFTFTSAVNAFGMTLTDPVDANGHVLSLTTSSGASFASVLSGPLPSGAERFLGVISATAFTSLSLHHGGPAADGMGIDEVHYGTVAAIPEPETYAMLAVGLAFLAWTRRRRLAQGA